MSTPWRKCRRLQPADYKSDLKPVWCAGCGDFGALAALHRAMAKLQLEPWNTVVVSGIGCSSRLPGYVETFGFNGVHGRALTLATGIKAVAAGAQRHRRRRRRRRHRDRRKPFPPRRAAQPRHRVPPDGQRDLRPDQGPGRARRRPPATRPSPRTGATRSPPSTRASSRSPSARRGSAAASRETRRRSSELMTLGDAAQGVRVLERHVPLRDLARRRPVQDPQGEAALPPGRSRPRRPDGGAAYTRETDTLTTGVLYEVREPSLVERIEEVRRKALAVGPVTSTADVLKAFSPGF